MKKLCFNRIILLVPSVSGQLYGKVFDASDDRNYDHIPISESDFIFSVAGEEFGFIGSCIILALYCIII